VSPLPERLPRRLPSAVSRQLVGFRPEPLSRTGERFDAYRYCRGCRHNAGLHLVRNAKPWPCHRCGCPGLEHDLLDAYVADWVARAATRRVSTIPEAVQRAVLARDGLVCRYCRRRVYWGRRGRRRTPGKLHFDHVLPWSRGGRETVDNIVVSCQDCNLAKHDDPTIVPPGWDALATRPPCPTHPEPSCGCEHHPGGSWTPWPRAYPSTRWSRSHSRTSPQRQRSIPRGNRT